MNTDQRMPSGSLDDDKGGKVRKNVAPNSRPHMDTSQKINHVYACQGPKMHVTPGFKLLQAGDIAHCPECGADVFDATDVPIGQAYIAYARIDLGERPS